MRKAPSKMFKSYKPKGDRIKAVQVTSETAAEIAQTFMGRVLTESVRDSHDSHGMETLLGVDIPTMEGIKHFPLHSWLVRIPDKGVEQMSDKDFNAMYESAYNVTRG